MCEGGQKKLEKIGMVLCIFRGYFAAKSIFLEDRYIEGHGISRDHCISRPGISRDTVYRGTRYIEGNGISRDTVYRGTRYIARLGISRDYCMTNRRRDTV